MNRILMSLFLLLVLALAACGATDTNDTLGADEPVQQDDVVAEAIPATDEGTDVVARLAELGVSLPDGAQLVTVDRGADDLEATFEVPGMSAEEVSNFFQQSLTDAGYTLEKAELYEIEFRNEVRDGDVDIQQNSDPTQFEIEIDSL